MSHLKNEVPNLKNSQTNKVLNAIINDLNKILSETLDSEGKIKLNKLTNVEDAIVNGVTDKAPSQNAVFDALTGKAATGHTHVAADVTNFNAAAQAATISQAITNGVLDKSPSEDKVFDALAGKSDTGHTHGGIEPVVEVENASAAFEIEIPANHVITRMAFHNSGDSIGGILNLIQVDDYAGIAANLVLVTDTGVHAFSSNITGTYANGTAGVGATIDTGAAGPLNPLVDTDLVLLYGQTTGAHNGVYEISGTGVNVVLTRITDFDESSEITCGKFFQDFDTPGYQWIMNTTGTITVGTTAITFTVTTGTLFSGVELQQGKPKVYCEGFTPLAHQNVSDFTNIAWWNYTTVKKIYLIANYTGGFGAAVVDAKISLTELT